MQMLEQQIHEFLLDFGFSSDEINDDIMLIGDDAKIKSRDLVEILSWKVSQPSVPELFRIYSASQRWPCRYLNR